MGYTTDFWGSVTIEPPLNEHEVSFLNDFAHTRRMARHKGAYYCLDTDNFGQNQADDVINHNGVGCVEDEWVDNPKHTPDLRYGEPGFEPRMMKVTLAEPICPPEFGTPAAQPGLWCQWVPGGDIGGDTAPHSLGWNGTEKFYDATEWMIYLIDNFLKPDAFATTEKGQELVALAGDPRLQHFTFDHVCNGVIEAQGEDSDDRWRIVVDNNEVEPQSPTVMWPSLPDHLL